MTKGARTRIVGAFVAGPRHIVCRLGLLARSSSGGVNVPVASSILIHAVFSTKNREPFIRPEVEQELYKYFATALRTLGCPSLAGNGTMDHVHLQFNLSRTMSVADVIKELKTDTSKWFKTKGKNFAEFHWQAGYGAFSIGQSNVEALRAYIADQKLHHQGISFQDEFRAFLQKYEVPFDERYVWD